MGMIANYQQITDRELEELKSNEDLFEDIEELQENENLDLCDLDKMWDALHFLLTGKSTDQPIENDLISEAIVGQINISGEEIEEFISCIRADRVKEIAAALQKINFETYLEKFNMSDFAQQNERQRPEGRAKPGLSAYNNPFFTQCNSGQYCLFAS